MKPHRYFLGCPVWSCPGWRKRIYPARAEAREWLHYYSKRFGTVEGNATFYAIPSPEVAQRWVEATEPGFRFALKFPRLITHDRQLVNADRELEAFLVALEILARGDRLGPTFLQLPPWFTAHQIPDLVRFLKALPTSHSYAVEFRHPSCFEPAAERSIDDVLRELTVDRVVFDSRPLFSSPPSDPLETQAQQRKPRSPLRTQVTGQHPMLRLIGRNRVAEIQPWLDEWSQQVALWIREGLFPYVFTHTPDDRFAPEMAEQFHRTLQAKLDGLDPLVDPVPRPPRQLELF